ncbi:hypothetical protein DVH24_000680 [Malus domestica]|uniref:Uncharacterized protein n=1 Tax=Malus domestica TaxID=3750 RepID=A0A498JYX5_MALDO|nr:hypothetical protein DVH24_000680 [Malus domestica]
MDQRNPRPVRARVWIFRPPQRRWVWGSARDGQQRRFRRCSLVGANRGSLENQDLTTEGEPQHQGW